MPAFPHLTGRKSIAFHATAMIVAALALALATRELAHPHAPLAHAPLAHVPLATASETHVAPGHDVMHTASAVERPKTSSTLISSHALPDMPGKEVTSIVVDFPPGAFSPEHHHEGSLTVYVLKGTVRSQLGGEPVKVFTTGESFFEPLGATHLFAENVSATEPAQILAVIVHDKGARLVVYH